MPTYTFVLLQGEVPGNIHLVMVAVHRREEVDHSRSLEGGATGPGGSKKTQGDTRIRLTVPRPLNYLLIFASYWHLPDC